MSSFWAAEIERKTKRPISLTGTSAGAIITGGLSVPKIINGVNSIFYPQYSASDILELFINESKNIFSNSRNFWDTLINAKYSDKGRSQLFTKFFNNYV